MSIPNELKQLNRWCVWKYVKRNGKKTKIPIDAKTGEFAKSNDESTWTDYEQSVQAVSSLNADGLGFFFKPPYIGIDIDDIQDDIERLKNGDIENNVIFEFYESLKTYAEFSPSGNGIHLILKGEIPGNARRKNNVEMYSSGRFFTMTGNSLGKYTEINEPSKMAIERLYRHYVRPDNIYRVDFGKHGVEHNLSDSEVIRQATESSQGAKFKDLLNGQWDKYDYPSQSEADIAFANMLAFWCAKDFAQMDRIFRKSGLYRDKWDEKRGKTTYGIGLLNKAINETPEVFTPSQKRAPLNYEFGGEFLKGQQKDFPIRGYDDTGNAERFIDRYGDVVKYSYNLKKFYVFNGSYWEIDNRGLIRKMIDQTVEDIKNEKVVVAEGLDPDDAKDNLMKHYKKSRANTAKKRILDEIQHYRPVFFEEFNPDDMFLNTSSGYVDLSNGEEYEHDKTKMFSYQTNAEYTNSQNPETWIDFLNDIFNYDHSLIKYIQKAVGYSLTGSTREQVMFILHGKGRNGKSIFIETISDILGTYADNIQAKTLMVKKGDTINNDVAKLQGRRLVTSSEPNEGFRFDEGLIKQLTGGDTVTARFLYGEEFNFNPKFKIWVTTNHKPLVRGTDDGIWRRLILIPFEVQIPEEKVDKDLKAKLMREAPAILNWAIEGCLMWQREGLKPPEKIVKASQGYRQEMDVLEQFFEDECVIAERDRVSASDLYSAYKKWADDTGAYKMNKNKFGMKMKEKFESKRTQYGIIYLGINIREKFPGLSKVVK